jgi:sulfate adenylyltransferase
MKYEISEETLQDLINIEIGLFKPLTGFMDAKDYNCVVNEMKLADGTVWTIPITLDVDEQTIKNIIGTKELILTFKDKDIALLEIEDIYKIQKEDIKKVYKTDDRNHPGVKKELNRYSYRVGGSTQLLEKNFLNNALNPKITKEYFKTMGWESVVGFQTRNVIHRAHEYLHRIGLEFCDALFINPLVGWKKVGDFSEKAVDNGYRKMIDIYYKDLNVYYDTLKTPMRYAGPREAIFHAIIRKNLGCTHFIIGRDHAGVGDYYGKYEAHKLAKQILKTDDLGIELLLLKEPYYCNICEQMVSENCCAHDDIIRISGTEIRDMLANSREPSTIYMRKEIATEIIKLKEEMFIK